MRISKALHLENLEAKLDKSVEAFRTISEVAEDLDLPQHVLRFWETRFNQIRPLKRAGGRRYYRPGDVDLLKGIRVLLYGQGFTIRGVQRILKEQGAQGVQALGRGDPSPPPDPLPQSDAWQETVAHELEAVAPAAADPLLERPPTPPSPSLCEDAGRGPTPQDAVARLRLALNELGECRRLLGLARGQETTDEAC